MKKGSKASISHFIERIKGIDWEKTRKIHKWVAYGLWGLFGLGFLFCTILLISASIGDLPKFEDLENPKYDLASTVYDRDGKVLGRYYVENRVQLTYEEISSKVKNALISTEDRRYFKHPGIDIRALFRVAFKTLILQKKSSGGGSTITQQLAKLLYERPSLQGKSRLGRAHTLILVKLKEWITAVKLEKSYTKEEIAAMYLNKFEFINGAHGLHAAAEIYFGKDQSDLSFSEAATLVGMLQNPARYNPNRFPERTASRRNIVLSQMRRKRQISRTVYDSLKILPIDLSHFKLSHQSEGPAPYFRAELTKWVKNLLDKPQYAKPDGTKYNVYTDGLQIHTTIDSAYQVHAEKAVYDHMSWNQARYWRVWEGMNPFIFQAQDYQKQLRYESVDRRIHYSDRYLNLFNRNFQGLNEEIEDDYQGFDLTEPALRILFNSPDPILQIDSFPNSQLINQYKKLANSGYWPRIEAAWNQFRISYENEFNEVISMKVFDYENGGEKIAEMSPRDSVIFHLRHLQAGLLAVDPHTGHIKAWVGGVDHRYFKFDHINSRRQVGSTIKPFVYATAIGLQGISPCQEFDDIQYSIAPGDANFHLDEEWSPSNADGEFTGNKYNLYQGLLYSKNSISVRLVIEMGNVDVIREMLDNVGISKTESLANGRLLIPRSPSICLGSVDLSVMEMTGAYTAFANNGIYTQPLMVDFIADKNGKVIYQSVQVQKQALNPTYNGVIVDMLKNNTGGGNGMGLKTENGGKTGTTNDYADAWYMGITPNLVVGTWVGGDEKWVRFFTLNDGQGFVMARPIFQGFIQALEQDSLLNFDIEATFTPPPKDYYDIVDCNRYKRGEPEIERDEIMKRKALNDEFEEEFDEIGAKNKTKGKGQ